MMEWKGATSNGRWKYEHINNVKLFLFHTRMGGILFYIRLLEADNYLVGQLSCPLFRSYIRQDNDFKHFYSKIKKGYPLFGF